jgi:DNA polymerase III epsilon subunit-like protein
MSESLIHNDIINNTTNIDKNKSDIVIRSITGLSKRVSNNFKNILDRIRGRKVFIFDLETTGLFNKKYFYKYWNNKIFNKSRIIEIGYYYSTNFGDDNFASNNIIYSYLRKPTDFDNIDPEAESKHGININKLQTEGYIFSKILNMNLIRILSNCDIIISHNTMFDFSILLNELYRFKTKNLIKYLLNIKKSGNLICTCKASGFRSLGTLYKLIFNDEPITLHRAGDDVKTLLEIIMKKKLDLQFKYILN